MASYELRPMGIGDILDTTFRMYRERFLPFLLIALVVYVPYAFLLALSAPFQTPAQPVFIPQATFSEGEMQTPTFDESNLVVKPNPVGAILGILGTIIYAFVLFPLCTAALVHNISASYLGEDLTAGQSYTRALPRLPGLLGTQILVGLAVFAGFLLLIVPGIIFSLWFLVCVPVVILENKAGPSAMGRSRELMRGNLNKGFVLALVLTALGFIINFALQMLTTLVPMPHPSISIFISTMVAAVILPIQTAPWTLLYYDLRIRKEAFDLQKLSEALSQAPAP